LLLRHLALQHFRNYAQLDVAFDQGVVVLQGANAQGKTNLLESIYILATTKSPRARSDADLVSWTAHDPLSPVGFARIVGRVERLSGPQTVEILIREASGEGQARKRFKLNGTEHRAGEVLGKVNAVFFSPTDVDLVAGSPSVRRHYLDVMLCQVDHLYFRSLNRFNRALVQRNALLRQVREAAQPPQALEYWDELLCEQGAQVIAGRASAVLKLASVAATWHRQLSGGDEQLEMRYKPALPNESDAVNLVDGGALAARAAMRVALTRLKQRDIAAGMSLAGPHRDDLTFAVNAVDVTAFGSRGQQRTATLALKLAELHYMRELTGELPLLLLDDATSELDERRRDAILGAALENDQTFVTSADPGAFGVLSGSVQRWSVVAGNLERSR
jgi:DNA replication and repair protein RecF